MFLSALDENLGPLEPEVHWTRPNGGLFVWLTVPEDLDTGFDGPLFSRCVEEGVIYVPGEHAFAAEPDAPPRNHIRLTFGVPSEADLVEGSRRLAAALNACLDPVS
jgi:2-aminoadipate transaminase